MRHVDLNQFDLNLLVALDALLMEKSVTRAGVRMHLSQSAMSDPLARLRRAFEDDLLVPIGRRMDLTPLGRELVQPVRDILLQIRNTMTTRAKFDAATSERHFSIAVSDYVTTILLQELLQRLASSAPHATFDLQPIGPRAIEDLERGHLDFLIAPRGYESPLHPHRGPLRRMVHVVAMARKHRGPLDAVPRTVPGAWPCRRLREQGGRTELRRAGAATPRLQQARRSVHAQLRSRAAAGRRHEPRRDRRHAPGVRVRATASADPAPGTLRHAADDRSCSGTTRTS